MKKSTLKVLKNTERLHSCEYFQAASVTDFDPVWPKHHCSACSSNVRIVCLYKIKQYMNAIVILFLAVFKQRSAVSVLFGHAVGPKHFCTPHDWLWDTVKKGS